MAQHSETYRQYLMSVEWKLRRFDALQAASYRCQRCGIGPTLEVHHRHYKTLGHEALEDLEVLCPQCHKQADTERGSRTAAHRSARLWGARVNGWACKRYGDDWDCYKSFEEVEEAFEAWLDARGEPC